MARCLFVKCHCIVPFVDEVVTCIRGGCICHGPKCRAIQVTDECVTYPCLNGAACTDKFGYRLCHCKIGYKGDNCGDIDYCSPNPCVHGSCRDKAGNYSCVCDIGYKGYNCDYNIDECSPNPCVHGTCVDGVGNYSCVCNKGYTGHDCAYNIDECSSKPCVHGTCVDGVGNYSCVCNKGYTGHDCAYDIDECSPNPCVHGTCVDGVGNYSCACNKGYTGHDCANNIDDCSSNPCLHGSCVDGVSSYTCVCDKGYAGHDCVYVISDMIKPTIILGSVKLVSEGTSRFVVPCYAEGVPVPTVIWKLVNGALPVNARQLLHYLVVENVTMADDGFYMCRASNELGQDIQVLHLSVKAKPTRKHTSPTITAPSTVQANYSSSVNLMCIVTGYPKPTISWIHNNQKIAGTSAILYIHKADNTTQGVYTCSATNDAGNSSADIMLKVVHEIPKITEPPKPTVVNAGSNHSFICKASGVPVPSVTWSFQPFGQTATTLQLTGTNISLVNMQKSGVLSCMATNQFGMDHAQANVIVVKGSGTPFG